LSLEDTIRGYTLARPSRDAAKRPKARSNRASSPTSSCSTRPIQDRTFGNRQTEVLITVVGGKIVYQSPNWKDSSPADKNAEKK